MEQIKSSGLWEAFWREEVPALLIRADGSVLRELPQACAVLPGSFNPLHEGHRKMAEAAAQILKKEVLFELSVTNVDKSTVDETEVLRRIEQFINYKSIAITRTNTFTLKTDLFSGCAFVVGYDTAERIIAPRYYASEAAMRDELKRIGERGGHFLVACRLQNDQLKCLEDLDLPSDLKPLFSAIPASMFRFDISSTILRQRE